MKLTRREWIRMGTGAGLVSMAGGWGSLLAGTSDPIMATIPSSGQAVPAIGIGTVKFRGDAASPDMEPLRKTLSVFHSMGGRLIDTSPNYGNSEQVLGHLLGELGLRQQVFMATKVDREDAAGGAERMEGSFRRLGSPIDLMQVHNLRGADVQLPTLFEWKERGRFAYVGITTHRVSQHEDIEKYMRAYPLDFVQLNYSLADRAAADRLLPLAQDKGIAILVNRPFGRGRLFSAVGGVDLPDWAQDIDAESWGQVFLKYVMSHPATTIPIPGTSKPHHAEDNMSALTGRLPDEALRREMERFIDPLIGT
jgi:aryl-alcohol dehydrogenase-like predicted oxidoreductase